MIIESTYSKRMQIIKENYDGFVGYIRHYLYDSKTKIETLHRENGPAVIHPDGTEFWFINGELHRLDGPSLVFSNGHKSWYIKGKRYLEKEYNEKIKNDY